MVVPASLDMVSLLGSGDVLLREVERLFPDVDIHVRGNEMRFTGPSSEVALVEQLVDEMVAVRAHRAGPDGRGRRSVGVDAPRS